MPVPVPRDRVVQFFRKHAGKPQKAKDVGRFLGLNADDRSVVRQALQDLADQGVLVQLEGKRFVLAGAGDAHKGVVQRRPGGACWFIPDDKKSGDAFLPPHEVLGVVDGDRVLARVERAARGPAAKIIRVLERRRTTVTGLFKDSGKARWVEADDNVVSGPIVIPPGPEGNAGAAKDGDVVEVLLVEPPTPVTTAVGRIVRSLGKRGKLDVEIERILAEKRIVRAFPPEVDGQAAALPPDPTEADWYGREDLRSLPLCTIDGETAKDFDDAVHARVDRRGGDKKSKGDIVVTVAIADVSHYVDAGSPLDVEAARRGTSIYYPGKVVPMLPEALSNGLCSLRPDVDRLCMVVEMTVRPDGSVHNERFYDAVMRSHARLTYTLAQKFLDGEALDVSKPVQQSLHALDEASQRLRKARRARGALDFDLPETVVALDDTGEPVKIHALERLNAHKLIEDLMVAANEAVATRFESRKWPCIYRIHEPPAAEKLERFTKLAQLLAGRRLEELSPSKKSKKSGKDGEGGGGPSPKALMAVMEQLADVPGKRALDSLLLRSMMQAKYAVDDVGHYGLGSDAYLHFTSPIRRYPDLVVHRLLKERIAHKKKPKSKDDDEALHALLEDIAATASNCERTATDVERAVDALHAAWFMKDHVGEEFEGLVQGVAEFGLFVLLQGVHVEGMVRVSDLGGDFFVYDDVRLRLVGERSGQTWSIGDSVRVRVAGVDLARRQIGLVLADAPAAAPARRHRDRSEDRGGERAGDDRRGGRGGRRGHDDGKRGAGGPARGGQGAGAPRQAIRGPDDLRRLFEEKNAGRGAPKARGGSAPGRGKSRGAPKGKRR